MNTKQILIILLSTIGIFGALYGVYVMLNVGIDPALIKRLTVEKPKERTLWNKEGKHTLVVFSDYQCPACKIFHDYLAEFTASTSPNLAITQNVSYVFRYFPLYQIHPHAYYLAYSAEAAGKQGKFEDLTKRFFADQDKLKTVTNIKEYVRGAVKELQMDEVKFQKDVDDKALQSVIQSDLQMGETLGVNATPTFFLDGKQLDSMAPTDLTKLLNALK